eukprot:PhM_4_TR13112/c0_g1_i1/m.11189
MSHRGVVVSFDPPLVLHRGDDITAPSVSCFEMDFDVDVSTGDQEGRVALRVPTPYAASKAETTNNGTITCVGLLGEGTSVGLVDCEGEPFYWDCQLYDGGGIVLRHPTEGGACLAVEAGNGTHRPVPVLRRVPEDALEGFTMHLHQFPVVDMREPCDDPLARRRHLQRACRLLGFFHIVGDDDGDDGPIARLVASVQSAAPTDAEKLGKVTLRTSTGRVKVSSVPCVWEDVRLPHWLAEGVGRNHIVDHITEYMEAASRAARRILDELDLGEVADETNLFTMVRAILYPNRAAFPQQQHNDGVVLDEHSDKCLVTLLSSTSLDGLDVVDFDGVTWVPTREIEGLGGRCHFFVNVGDAAAMASGGMYLSKVHRARNRG